MEFLLCVVITIFTADPLLTIADNTSNSAKWAFFVFLIVIVIFLFGYTFLINVRRIKRGAKPVRGTAWITPPSYQQSQRHYNEPVVNPVPPYSQEARPEDAGYYDQSGVFHANPNVQKEYELNGGVTQNETGTSNMPYPDSAHIRNDSQSHQYTRPAGPPPGLEQRDYTAPPRV
ncbi:unnamed protein product [Kuraishia capsulata CBS 1993]|uniref:Uncharacterized protein n=1 Tax=Kuraishia capsulata CBS 1993 TaxID=1382522 RepID=W6MMP1_9ASCO|nr:uncharacterized protein KUCA_T00003456001 [Kuraishia capsulata CBS 1993]CDK27478.1 unnamed protein product [Kuraishia capsulata CBS 1993]